MILSKTAFVFFIYLFLEIELVSFLLAHINYLASVPGMELFNVIPCPGCLVLDREYGLGDMCGGQHRKPSHHSSCC